MFKDLEWLSAFQSDKARLIALVIVVVATIIISCARPISQAWLADRKDRRKFEIDRIKLLNKLESEIERRKRERLDL